MQPERGPGGVNDGDPGAPRPTHRWWQLPWRLLPRLRLRMPRRHWRSSFGPLERPLLHDDDGDRYRGARSGGGYALALERPHLFAWVAADLGAAAFRDLRVRVTFESADGSPASHAAGLLLRYIDDRHFYYCLLSGDGRVRFDVVFNGSPRVLLDWTGVAALQRQRPPGEGGAALPKTAAPLPGAAASHTLEVVAADTRFVIAVDEEWVASCQDDTLAAGGAGVAAQSYDRVGSATVCYRELEIEARPIEVDRWWLRWERALPKRRDQRWLLAQSLFASGHYGEVAAELRRLGQGASLSGEQTLTLARALAAGGHLDDAERELRDVATAADREVAAAAGDAAVVAAARYELASLYYARNEFVRARDQLLPLVDPSAAPSAEALNVYGNTLHALGDFGGAAGAYLRASEQQPAFPLFHRNAARALEEGGCVEEAVASYGEAGRLLLRQEALLELDLVVDALARIATAADATGSEQRAAAEPATRRAAMLARALGGGRAFVEGRYAEAERAFADLVADPTGDDAVVTHLYGLCLLHRGETQEALRRLQEAAELEPENHTFGLRLAQTRYGIGELGEEELQRLVEVAGDDPYVLHLQAVVMLDQGDAATALPLLERAREAGEAAGDVAIAVDYAEALAALGRLEDALEALEMPDPAAPALPGISSGGTPVAAAAGGVRLPAAAQLERQKARLLSGAGRLDDAADAWERAETAAPGDADVVAGALAASIAADRIMRGEELLARLLDLRADGAAHNLAGNLAGLKGEYRRAEAAYREGLRLVEAEASGDEASRGATQGDLRRNLVALLLQTEDYPRARAELDTLLEVDGDHPRTVALLARVRRRYERRIECADCAREWWVPQQLPPQPALRLRGEPPHEAPGGRCPECGRVLCVGCAQHHLRESRFVCARCDVVLTIADEDIRFALRRVLASAAGTAADAGEQSVSAVG